MQKKFSYLHTIKSRYMRDFFCITIGLHAWTSPERQGAFQAAARTHDVTSVCRRGLYAAVLLAQSGRPLMQSISIRNRPRARRLKWNTSRGNSDRSASPISSG